MATERWFDTMIDHDTRAALLALRAKWQRKRKQAAKVPRRPAGDGEALALTGSQEQRQRASDEYNASLRQEGQLKAKARRR